MDKERYKEYENLLIERDSYLHDAGSFYTAYMNEFGDEMIAVFEKKIECIRKKKCIAFCQMKRNRGEEIDPNELDNYITAAMKDYSERFKRLVEDNDFADKAASCSQEQYIKAKRIYRRIAKRIHPDTNPDVFTNEHIRELWERVSEAYAKNDADELEALDFRICALLEELGEIGERPKVEDLEEKIEKVINEINEILTTDPYTYGDLLDDRELVDDKHDALAKELEEYTAYSRELDDVLGDLLGTGVVISWEMKL